MKSKENNTTNNTSSTENTNSSIYGNQPVKIHLILVANTLISDIGTSTMVDLNNMVSEVTGISEVLGVEMNKILFTDKQFTKKNVENFMLGFKPGLNDLAIATPIKQKNTLSWICVIANINLWMMRQP